MKSPFKSLLITFVILLVFSCQKDKSRTMLPNDKTDEEIIAQAKAYVESFKKNNGNTNGIQLGNVQPNLTTPAAPKPNPGTENYGNATVIRDPSGINLTTVPYTPNTGSALQLTANGFRRQLVYQDLTGANRAVWLEVDSDTPSANGSYTLSTFTGKLLLFDLNNNFLLGERYTSGTFTSEIFQGTPDQINYLNQYYSSRNGKTSVTEPFQTTICADWYTNVCVEGYGCTNFTPDGSLCVTFSSPQVIQPYLQPILHKNNGYGGGDGFGGGGSSATRPASDGFQKGSLAILDQVLSTNKSWMIPCAMLEAYKSQANFVPPQSVLDRAASLSVTDPSFSVQGIYDASGIQVNLDLFAVSISSLPVVNGVRLTADQFFEYIRTNLNSFVNTTYGSFSSYNYGSVNDNTLYNSSNPLGALVHIAIPAPAPFGELSNDGTVVVSAHTNNSWTFTTMYSPLDGTHPVSGNRVFTYTVNPGGGITIFTSGSDRIQGQLDDLLNFWTDVAFDGADNLWKSWTAGIQSFVNNHAGSADDYTTAISSRPEWSAVKDYLAGKISLSTLQKNGGCVGSGQGNY